MRWLVTLMAGFLVGSFIALIPVSAATADGCKVVGRSGDPRDYWFKCQRREDHDGGGPLGGGNRSYEFLWLPTCPQAIPGRPGAEEVDCRLAHSCGDRTLTLQSLYDEILDSRGRVLRNWRYLYSECRDARKVGATKKRILHWSDVRSAIRKMGLPPALAQGPRFTLVNLNTTFYTSATPIDKSLRLLGFLVDVHVQPVSYIWHWGDGVTTTTHRPGRPYPARDVMHTYRHSTLVGMPRQLRVDVAYRARFRVDGGPWIAVNDELVVAGSVRELPVKQASAVLVPPR